MFFTPIDYASRFAPANNMLLRKQRTNLHRIYSLFFSFTRNTNSTNWIAKILTMCCAVCERTRARTLFANHFNFQAPKSLFMCNNIFAFVKRIEGIQVFFAFPFDRWWPIFHKTNCVLRNANTTHGFWLGKVGEFIAIAVRAISSFEYLHFGSGGTAHSI